MSKCSQEFLSLADDCLHQFAQTESDKLSSILTSDDHNSFHASYPGCRVRDFPPIKTISLFMRQVASDTKSCRHALIDEARDQVVKSNKNKVPNTQTSAYCKARQRLTEASIRGLLRTSGNSLDHASPESWLWNQRRVLLTDGSTLLMPDTEKNQEEYPQPGTQQKGLGFPILRILVLICLGSDALLDFAVAPTKGRKPGNKPCSGNCSHICMMTTSC